MKKAFTLIELLIVVAIIAILAAIAVPNFLEAQTRAKVSRVTADMRSYATGLETYFIDNNTYPIHFPRDTAAVGAWGTGTQPTRNINFAMLNSASQATAPWENVSTFAVGPAATSAIGLTTPVSYLNTYSPDAFASQKQATFGYATGTSTFLIWSSGPDGVHQLDGTTAAGVQGNGNDAEYIVGKSSNLPSPFLIAGPAGVTQGAPTGFTASGQAYTYDATNGTGAAGDVYRTK